MWGGSDEEGLLRQGMLALDEIICQKVIAESDRSGTCAVVALVREEMLVVAHCGDCRAVLFWNDSEAEGGLAVRALTEDHRPDRKDERARIEAAGGFVTLQSEPDLAALHRKTPAQLAELQRVSASSQRTLAQLVGNVQIARIMGSLAVSRSLGDVGFKERKESLFPGRSFVANLVIAEPEVLSVPLLHPAVLILACDGLWDVLSPQKAASIASAALKSGKTVKETSNMLVERAIRRGTLDNVTLVLVVLPKGGEE